MGEVLGIITFGVLAWWILNGIYKSSEESRREQQRKKILHEEFLKEHGRK